MKRGEEIITTGAEQTHRRGEKLAGWLRPGSVVALTGDLGSGKTTLVQGIARGLGVEERYLFSPTFVLVRQYRGRVPFCHVDLYRVESEGEAADLGLEEFFSSGWVTAIEWAEKIPALLPPETIRIELELLDLNRRKITIIPPPGTV